VQKTILITGSTDGIGLETAKILVSQGHHVLLHGRNPEKLENVENALSELAGGGRVNSYLADLSRMVDVDAFTKEVAEQHTQLDVLINNAGIFRTSDPITEEGLDVRFAVNTIAPYLITKRLLPLMGASGRIINLSSAAQSPVNLDALTGRVRLSDELEAYAQSKLAITAWSRVMALSSKGDSPAIIAVNPGSLLGTKMVKEGFGMAGSDIRIGAGILIRAALEDEFATASGKYFDNDSGRFVSPHPDAMDPEKSEGIMHAIEAVLAEKFESYKKSP
jgi:NAD(P)-dependent dehydrogenase (short-subunit alcohol dehydrogenase family)